MELTPTSGVVPLCSNRQVPSGDQIVSTLGLVQSGQQVTRQLFGDEFIKGDVLIKRIDHPISVPPCVGVRDVVFSPTGFGVAGDIQPVASPMLGVRRSVEQLVDIRRESVRTLIKEQRIEAFWVGGKSGQIQTRAAGPGAEISIRIGLDPGRLQFGQDEVIDGSGRPTHILHGGCFGIGDGLKRPMLGEGVGIKSSREIHILFAGGHIRGNPRVWRPHTNPLFEISNGVIGQLSPRWHRVIIIFPADRLNQQTRIRIAGQDGGASAATSQQINLGVEPQAPPCFPSFLRVAAVAVVHQDGTNMSLEEFSFFGTQITGRKDGWNKQCWDHQGHLLLFFRPKCQTPSPKMGHFPDTVYSCQKSPSFWTLIPPCVRWKASTPSPASS